MEVFADISTTVLTLAAEDGYVLCLEAQGNAPTVLATVFTQEAVTAVIEHVTGVLVSPASQGETGPQGEKGDQGQPGVAAGVLLFPITAAASFTASHNFVNPPKSWIIDAGNVLVDTDTLYAPGQVTVVFPEPFTGTLYLG